ncbi:MAG: hypothetical protein KGZ66_07870 [Selenomonadales bacterium]|nr:hypothetical protein [Selenomonadales bacterium]
MGRQERRRRLRKEKPSLPWDLIIAAVVLVVFIGIAVWSYFFPLITAQSYAEGSPRVHRHMISRAVRWLEAKPVLEVVYSYTDEKNQVTQFHVREEGSKITLTDPRTKEAKEHAPDTVPDTYVTIAAKLAQLRQALRDPDFVPSHQEPEPGGHQILRLTKQVGQDVTEGFLLHFMPDHNIDAIHYFRRVADNVYIQRFYSGFITGIPAAGTQP